MSRTESSFRVRVATLNGYDICKTISGGKAGYGCNRTASIQVYDGPERCKVFRYEVAKPNGYIEAVRKAEQFVFKQQKASR